MAVELAKVALWLHTFTAGAPLSFIDHHLRCGNSLFGCWAREAFEKTQAEGSPLFLHEPLDRATSAAMAMRTIEDLTDAEIEETDRSAGLFGDIRSMTAPLDAFLTLPGVPRRRSRRAAVSSSRICRSWRTNAAFSRSRRTTSLG